MMRLPSLIFFLFFTLLVSCSKVFAQTGYNAIATAYVTTTISQYVVFDSTMQQGGTFTFSALAHNGGGRANESDTANVAIAFYNASGQAVNVTGTNLTLNYKTYSIGPYTAASTSINNLPNPNAVCGNPCIDTAVPWTTLSISATLTAADAANVAYAKVTMFGVDGSFWAGDYGPWYRAPTFQQNGGGNLLYNPEFGPYNGITAQGWTSSPGFGACQGAWGGSNACIVNSDGVPGSSTVGLVANANGGGPSATGGTTSGTAGGYNNTMTVTNAGTGATAGSTPSAPTVTSTSTSYTYRTVVTGNTTRVYRTLVTTTNYSDGTSTSSNGTEELYYTAVVTTSETNGIVGGNLATTITTTTTTTYNNGTQTVSSSNSYVYYGTINQTNAPGDQIVTSGPYGPTGPTASQQTRIDTWINHSSSYNNEIYIDQTYGSNNSVTIVQDGYNNRIDFTLSGNGNAVSNTQTGSNYLKIDVPGWGNNITTTQTNTVGTNYAETKIQGNGNTVNHQQTGNANQMLFSTVTGDINSVTTIQSGNAAHYAESKILGNWNSVKIDQSGNVANKATVDVTNAGGAVNVDIQQSGGKSFGIIQSCINPAGCSTVIRQ